MLAIRYVIPHELVPELEQVLIREIGNDDVCGGEVRYDLLDDDDIERISGSVNEALVRKLSASSIVFSRVFSSKPVSTCSFLVGGSPNGMMTNIRLVSFLSQPKSTPRHLDCSTQSDGAHLH